MSLMVDENGVTFKEIEKEIFNLICEAGRDLTREVLERCETASGVLYKSSHGNIMTAGSNNYQFA